MALDPYKGFAKQTYTHSQLYECIADGNGKWKVGDHIYYVTPDNWGKGDWATWKKYWKPVGTRNCRRGTEN